MKSIVGFTTATLIMLLALAHDLAAFILFALLMILMLGLGGCSSRTYTYRSPDGAVVNLTIVGTDAQVGVIDAGRDLPDGSKVWLHVENLTQTDRAIGLAQEALKKLPNLPLPIMP